MRRRFTLRAVPELVLDTPARSTEALRTDSERAARLTMLDQVARLEAELSQLFCSTWPRKAFRFEVRGRGGPRLLSLAELEELRDDLADRVAGARRSLSDRTWRGGGEPPPDRGDARCSRAAQVEAGVGRGHRGAGLPSLARAAALRRARDADGLVAGGHQLGLSVSRPEMGSRSRKRGGPLTDRADTPTRVPSATRRGASAPLARGRPRGPAGPRPTSARERPGGASRCPSS